MPVLEANSEAFLNFYKGLQKGKGTENASLVSSEAFSEPKFTADDWKSPATVTKDFAAASKALGEPVTNEKAESDEKLNNVDFEKSGAGSPGLAEKAAAHVAYGHTDTDDPTAVEPPVNNEANYYAATSNDHTVSKLQIITRSMTASGGDTTLANNSAATETCGLVSSGSEFLKALPKASGAFKAGIRGGVDSIEVDNDPTTPISATSSNDYGIATYADVLHQSPEVSLASFREYALPNPEEAGSSRDLPTSFEMKISTNASSKQPKADASSLLSPGQEDFSEMWGVKNTSRGRAAFMDKPAAFTNTSYREQPNTVRVKGPPRFYPRGVRYTVAEMLEIRLEKKLGLLEQLVELGGYGRVEVGILLKYERFQGLVVPRPDY